MATKKNAEAKKRVPLGTAAIPLAVALFLGLMCVVTTGFFFRPIYSLAAPFVCQGGELETETYTYTPDEGGVGYSNRVTCVDGGQRSDVSMSATVIAGLLLTVIFGVILVPLWFRFATPVEPA